MSQPEGLINHKLSILRFHICVHSTCWLLFLNWGKNLATSVFRGKVDLIDEWLPLFIMLCKDWQTKQWCSHILELILEELISRFVTELEKHRFSPFRFLNLKPRNDSILKNIHKVWKKSESKKDIIRVYKVVFMYFCTHK